MQAYKDKAELIEEIKKRYLLYDQEFDDIKEDEKDWLKKLHLRIYPIRLAGLIFFCNGKLMKIKDKK